MKSQVYFTGILVFCLAVVCFLAACQQDPRGGANQTLDSGALEQDEASGSKDESPDDSKKLVERYISQVQKLQDTYGDFQKNLLALQQEVAALPATYKQRATGFTELEARLAKFPEKGKVMEEEAAQIIQELKAALTSDWSGGSGQAAGAGDAAILGTVMIKRIKELELSAPEYQRAYLETEQAVMKLKQAKGAAVVLF